MRRAVTLLWLLLVPAPAASSSLTIGVQDRRLGVETGFAGVSDPVGNTQTSLRATWTWDLGERWTIVTQGGGASSWLELNDTRLTGLTDLRVRALYRPDPEWALGVGTILPFGLYELTATEVTTAQWAWLPNSGFPITRFGEGWGWELTVARAFSLSSQVSAGIAGAWLRHAEFSLLEGGAGEYRLGSEGSVSAAVDVDLMQGRRLRADLRARFFGADELAGHELVDQGNQVDVGLDLQWPWGAWTSSWGLRAAAKGDNEYSGAAAGDTVAVLSQSPGTQLILDARLGRGAGSSLFVYVHARWSRLMGTDYIQGDGWSLGVGPGIGWEASGGLRFGFRYGYITGGADGIEGFDGHDLLLTLEISP